MRVPKRGERGFTLIELLIVVAILGVLAAIVIPQVTRFIGSGEEEAAKTEFANIQAAVTSMMIDNEISVLLTPVLTTGTPTANMSTFPDTTPAATLNKVTDTEGFDFEAGTDKNGYILFGHDRTGGETVPGPANPDQTDVNYVQTQDTVGTYSVTADGTVTQESTGY